MRATCPDEELLTEYGRTGDREAFEELVRRYEREIHTYLWRNLGDAHLAEDALQATLLQLHLKCRQFEPGRKLRPWLYTIASHQAVDLRRRNRRHKAVSIDAPAGGEGTDDERQPLHECVAATDADPSELLGAAEEQQKARSAVQRIPEKLKQVVLLVVYQGLKYREAADALGIPFGTVKSRLNKAMHSLHKEVLS